MSQPQSVVGIPGISTCCPTPLNLKHEVPFGSGAVKVVGGLVIVGGDKRRPIVAEAEHIVAGAALARPPMSRSPTPQSLGGPPDLR